MIKRKICVILCITLIMGVAFFSCKKSSIKPTHEQTIYLTKIWFDSISKTLPQVWDRNRYNLDWDNIMEFTSEKDVKYQVVPYLNLVYFPNSRLVLSRQLIIEIGSNSKPIKADIVEIFSDEIYLKNNKYKLSINSINKNFNNFTGGIILWDIAYKEPYFSAKYTNGIMVGRVEISSIDNKRVSIQSLNKQNLFVNSITNNTRTNSYLPPPPPDCNHPIYWFFITYDSVIPIDYEYLGTTCDAEIPTEGGQSNWGNYTGSNTPNPPPLAQVQRITDSLQNPCLNGTWNLLMQKGFTDTIVTLLNKTFGASDKFNITVVEVPNLTNANGVSLDGHTHVDRYPTSGIIDIKLQLNSTTLPSATQEFTAATILHEIIHAYLSATGQSGLLNQENAIAQSYVNKIFNSLKTSFPSLSDDKANALAWGGLDGTNAWINLSQSTKDSYLIENNRQHAGQNGTICNTDF